MARPMKPLVRGGGFYPSRKWTPLVYAGGYTTANGGEEPAPPPIEKTVTGNPIHILDALAKPAQALSVKLEPIQDLNGYGNPWPAGGGKNILPLVDGTYAVGATGATAVVSNGSIKITGTTTASGGRTSRLSSYFILKAGTYIISPLQNTTPYVRGYLNKRSDNTALGYSGGTAITVAEDTEVYYGVGIENNQTYNITVKPQVEAGSTVTTWQPYSNICPISGWDAVKVTRTGRNLCSSFSNAYISKGTSNSVYLTGTGTTLFFECVNGVTYTVSGISINRGNFAVFDSMPANGARTTDDGTFTVGTTATFTPTKSGVCAVYVNNALVDVSTAQIEVGSTASSYEPYTAETYSITFPTSAGTVYGGTLDVLTGVLTIDRAGVDMGTLSWQLREGLGGFSAAVTPTPKNLFVAISSCYPYDGVYSDVLDKAFGYVYLNQVFVRDSAYSDAETLKTALNGQTLVYELATPITIQLTGQQVELLLGENNLFSDGEMTLVYLADGNVSDVEALNILLGGRYVNNHGEDEPSDREALDIVLGGKK